MSTSITVPAKSTASGLGFFERYLSIWVALCMAAGIVLGKLLPSFTSALRSLEFGRGSQINVPIAVLIWLMIRFRKIIIVNRATPRICFLIRFLS